MTVQELQRICDTFHVGKILEWNRFSECLFTVKTNQGDFYIAALTFDEWTEIEKEKIEDGLKKKFPELPSVISLVFTQETYIDNTNLLIPCTHKYDRYWFCLRH